MTTEDRRSSTETIIGSNQISRRKLLKILGAVGATLLLTSCTPPIFKGVNLNSL